ncbi:MAG: TVP38/TMEM64 family protein [Clostridia bacterium]|nr:TVP38/TMEM64 family protein [Clostridia bacterium]
MKEKSVKAVIIIVIIVLVCFLLYQSFGSMLPGLIKVLKSGNDKQIAEYLNSIGTWDGMLCVVLLQFIQVLSVFIPGMPIQIAAGAVYGAVKATILCYFGYVTANIVVFCVARRLGTSFFEKSHIKLSNQWMEDKMKKINPAFVVMLGCLMPAVPNGMIPYLAANTELTKKNFTISVALGSFLPIVISCMAGHFLLSGDYLFSIISILVLWVLIIVLIKKQEAVIKVFGRIMN